MISRVSALFADDTAVCRNYADREPLAGWANGNRDRASEDNAIARPRCDRLKIDRKSRGPDTGSRRIENPIGAFA